MALLPEAKNCDISVKRNFQIISSKLGYNTSPTHANITLTDLTASSLVGTNASKLLESVRKSKYHNDFNKKIYYENSENIYFFHLN